MFLREITVNGDTARLGDEVLIRLHPGLHRRDFGSGWRAGIITGIGQDVLAGEQVIDLDAGKPIYAAHIKHMSVLSGGRG